MVQSQPLIGNRVLKITDRVHYSEFARHCPYTITSTILPRYCMSDHAPMVATIHFVAPHTKPSLYRVNSHHLKDEKLLSKLNETWEESCREYLLANDQEIDILFKGLYRSKRMIRTFGKDKANQPRRREVQLRENLVAAQIALEGAPQSTSLQVKVVDVESQMQSFTNDQAKWMLDTIQKKWMQSDGTCTKSVCHFQAVVYS